jgi:hypothetical protein
MQMRLIGISLSIFLLLCIISIECGNPAGALTKISAKVSPTTKTPTTTKTSTTTKTVTKSTPPPVKSVPIKNLYKCPQKAPEICTDEVTPSCAWKTTASTKCKTPPCPGAASNPCDACRNGANYYSCGNCPSGSVKLSKVGGSTTCH